MSTLHRINPENWSTRSPAFIVCAALVGVTGIALVLVLVLGRGGSTLASPAALCEQPASEQTDIYSTPEAAWINTGIIQVPASETAGPSINTTDTNACYARSPEGAVFAAMNLVAMDLDGQSRTLYEDRAVEGPARDRALEQIQTNVAPSPAIFRGFSLVDYSPDAATIELVIEDSPYLGALTVEVVWDDGDWKLDPPTSLEPPVKTLSSLQGYHTLSPRQGD